MKDPRENSKSSLSNLWGLRPRLSSSASIPPGTPVGLVEENKVSRSLLEGLKAKSPLSNLWGLRPKLGHGSSGGEKRSKPARLIEEEDVSKGLLDESPAGMSAGPVLNPFDIPANPPAGPSIPVPQPEASLPGAAMTAGPSLPVATPLFADPLPDPATEKKDSLSDDLLSLFNDVETVDEALELLSSGLAEVNIDTLADECQQLKDQILQLSPR